MKGLAAVTHGGSGTVHHWSLANLPTGGVSSGVGRLPLRRDGGVCVCVLCVCP